MPGVLFVRGAKNILLLRMEVIRNLPPVSDLLMAKPTADVQITLAIIHACIWFYLINKIFVPIIVFIISNLKTKERFI